MKYLIVVDMQVDFITGNFLLLIFLCIGVVLLIKRSGKPGILKNLRDKFLLKLPVAGPLIVSVQISTFLQAMSIMTRSHVHLLSALKLAQNLIGNVEIRRSFETVSAQIREGEKLSDVFAEIIYLPSGTPAMLKVAEESGEVGEMFYRILQEEQSVTRLKFKRLLAMLEPLIIMVLAVMVMAVVLAVFMAIWKMNSIR